MGDSFTDQRKKLSWVQKLIKCSECTKVALKLDVSNINWYQVGETTIGNLDKYGWVVLRGIDVSNVIQSYIRSTADKCVWHNISTKKQINGI